MKVIRLLLATTLLALGATLTSCSNDDDKAGMGKALTRLTLEDEDGYYQSLHFSWEDNKVSFIQVWESNRYGNMLLSAELTPEYRNGKLESCYAYSAEDRSGITLQGNYTGNQLTQVQIPREDPALLSYDTEGNLRSININHDQLSFSWSGGRITQIIDPDGRSVSVTCDDKRNPLNDVIRCIIGSWSATMGNITRLVNYRGETVDLQYTFDGDYPSQCRVIVDGKVGGILYYEYADGSGSAPANLPANYSKKSWRIF
ncbi:MAG: hypothetical protein J6I49_08450 [Bacteroidales bacterium]|nr:hypothetical protein [Bacteroidales bacterium]